MIEFWHHIYDKFDPVAFKIFGFPIHWYSLMYISALVGAMAFAEFLIKKDKLPLTKDELEKFFLWVEIGVILGARVGYILFYEPNKSFYFTQPWQIFNPFKDGEFVGIRGMSYHGALFGFLIGAWLYSKYYKKNFLFLMDISAVSVPIGYFFGRIGNFLNKELYGRKTEMEWGIYVDNVLRHPSQLYEAALEGILLFCLLYFGRKKKNFDGELMLGYGFFYGILRFIAEFFREPDPQLGFVCCNWMSMGQVLCAGMIGVSLFLYFILRKEKSYATK